MILRTVLEPEHTFADALGAVAETFNLHNRHADFHFMDFLRLQMASYGMKIYEWFAMVTFTMIAFDVGGDLPFRAKAYCTGTTPMPVYVILSTGDTPGSLRVIYEYQHKRIDVAALRQCHAAMLDVIRTGIRDPSITMRELLDLPEPAADAAR